MVIDSDREQLHTWGAVSADSRGGADISAGYYSGSTPILAEPLHAGAASQNGARRRRARNRRDIRSGCAISRRIFLNRDNKRLTMQFGGLLSGVALPNEAMAYDAGER